MDPTLAAFVIQATKEATTLLFSEVGKWFDFLRQRKKKEPDQPNQTTNQEATKQELTVTNDVWLRIERNEIDLEPYINQQALETNLFILKQKIEALQNARKALAVLQKQKEVLGHLCPPHIIIGIDDTEKTRDNIAKEILSYLEPIYTRSNPQ